MLRELSMVEQRYDAVSAVIREGMAVTEVAEKFGVHYDLVPADAGGDRGQGARVAAEPAPLGTDDPASPTRRDGVEPLPSVSGIHRALLRHRLIEPRATRKLLPTSDFDESPKEAPFVRRQLLVLLMGPGPSPS